MARNELPPPEFDTLLPINTDLFQGRLRACTNSIFCAGASAETIHHIAHRAKVSVAGTSTQALPTTGTPDHPVNLGNYNLQGTGEAYRQLIKEKVLEIKDGHAETVRVF